MKTKKTKRVRVVDGADAAQFEERLNDVLGEIESPEITFDRNRPFLAYVTYTETVEIPTTIREAYEMRGETHTCKECPYFEKQTDRRRKYSICDLGEHCTAESDACDLFYKMLNSGTLANPKKIVYR